MPVSSNVYGAITSTLLEPVLFGHSSQYSIHASEYFLLPEAQKMWRKEHREWGHSDVPAPPTPAFWALTALSKIVPAAPDQIKFDEGGPVGSRFSAMLGHTWDANTHYDELKPYITQWQVWIATHKDELSKLEPTGEGVNFSPQACKNGKSRQTRPER
jgi:hypothetical protein